MSIKGILKEISLFSDLSDDEIDLIVPLVKENTFEHSEVIIEEGKPGRKLYIIAKGQVEIRKRIDDDRKKLLAVLDEGAFFGEITLFDYGLRTASVISAGNTTILEVDGDRFNDLLSAYPPLGVKVLRTMMTEMVHRLRRSDELIRDFVIWAIYGKKK